MVSSMNMLTYSDECFIARKQNQIRENALKIAALKEIIEDLEAEQQFNRETIRNLIGRNNK